MDRRVLEEEIRMVAYELYVKSGCIPGRDLDNWLEAERMVLAKYGMLSEEKTPEEEASQVEEKLRGKTRSRKKSEESSSCKRTRRRK